MHARHWLIGSILCVIGSTAMASSRAGQDVDSSVSRTVSDGSSTQHDGSSDMADLTARSNAPRSSTPDTTTSTPSSGDHSAGGGSAPPPVRQPHLGWQSLLPGSIQ